MTKLNLFKSIALTLGCAELIMISTPAEAGAIKAHAGTTFTLTPVEFTNGIPAKFTHTVDGVVRVSLLGNCTVHADVVAVPSPDFSSFSLTGTFRITSADGNTTLDAEVKGVATTDPDNPSFANFHYDVKFTGGTGQMANARGTGDIDGFGMFTSETKGTATWLLQGNVATHGHGRR